MIKGEEFNPKQPKGAILYTKSESDNNLEYYSLIILFKEVQKYFIRFQNIIDRTIDKESKVQNTKLPKNLVNTKEVIENNLNLINEALELIDLYEIDVYYANQVKSIDYDSIRIIFKRLIYDFKTASHSTLLLITKIPNAAPSDIDTLKKYLIFHGSALKLIQRQSNNSNRELTTLLLNLLLPHNEPERLIREMQEHNCRVISIMILYLTCEDLTLTISQAKILDDLNTYLTNLNQESNIDLINAIIASLEVFTPSEDDILNKILLRLNMIPDSIKGEIRDSLNKVANEIIIKEHTNSLHYDTNETGIEPKETQSNSLIQDLNKYEDWLDCNIKINLPHSGAREKFYGFLCILNELYQLDKNKSLVERFGTQEGKDIAQRMQLSFVPNFLQSTKDNKKQWKLRLTISNPGYRAVLNEIDGRVEIVFIGTHPGYEKYLS